MVAIADEFEKVLNLVAFPDSPLGSLTSDITAAYFSGISWDTKLSQLGWKKTSSKNWGH